MRAIHGVLFLVGRLLIATIFILSGIEKIINFDATTAYMAKVVPQMPMIPFFLFAAAIVELIGGLSIVVGYRARWGALLLFLYLIPTTVLFHHFWDLEGMEAALQRINFLKNLAIQGGLLYIIAVGAGVCSCDACGPKQTVKK